MRLLRILGGLIGTLLFLVLIGIGALVFFVDANDFKPTIVEQVKLQTGRDLTFQGDIELSVFPRLALKLSDISLSNAPGFDATAFAKVKQVEIGVRLIPLLQKQLEIGRVYLDTLELALTRKSTGESNWDDLIATGSETAPAPSTHTTNTDSDLSHTALAGFSLAGITIANSRFIFQDAGSLYLVDKLNLHTGRVRFGQAFPVSLSLHSELSEPQLEAQLEIKTDITIDETLQQFSVKDLVLKLVAHGEVFPSHELALDLQSQLEIDLAKDLLSVPMLKLAGYGMVLNATAEIEQLTHTPAYRLTAQIESFNPRMVLAKLKLAQALQAPEPYLTQAALSLSAQGTPETVEISQLIAQLDKTSLVASASVKDFTHPAVEFKVDINALDLDPFLNSTEDTKAETSTAPNEKSSAAAEELLPVQVLRDLNIKGEVKLGQLKAMNLNVHNLVANLDAHQGRVALSPLRFDLYSGHFNANVIVNVQGEQPRIMLNQKLSGIQFESLLQDLLQDTSPVRGRGELSLDISTTGNQMDVWLERLTGKGLLVIRDGALTGMNIAHLIRQAEALLSTQAPPKDANYQHTDFSALTGTFEFRQGRAINPDLSIEMPLARVNGQGYLDLTQLYLDYQVSAHVAATASGQDGKSLERVRDVAIPIVIKGPVDDLTYSVDREKLIGQKLKAEEARLKRKLEDEKQKANDKAQKQVDEKKEEIKGEAQEKLKKQLDKLLRF